MKSQEYTANAKASYSNRRSVHKDRSDTANWSAFFRKEGYYKRTKKYWFSQLQLPHTKDNSYFSKYSYKTNLYSLHLVRIVDEKYFLVGGERHLVGSYPLYSLSSALRSNYIWSTPRINYSLAAVCSLHFNFFRTYRRLVVG
jgi:hypothetical protein